MEHAGQELDQGEDQAARVPVRPGVRVCHELDLALAAHEERALREALGGPVLEGADGARRGGLGLALGPRRVEHGDGMRHKWLVHDGYMLFNHRPRPAGIARPFSRMQTSLIVVGTLMLFLVAAACLLTTVTACIYMDIRWGWRAWLRGRAQPRGCSVAPAPQERPETPETHETHETPETPETPEPPETLEPPEPP